MIQVFLTLITNRLLDILIIYNTKFVQKMRLLIAAVSLETVEHF